MPYGDKKSYSFFKMKGHTLPGPFQRKIWPPEPDILATETGEIEQKSITQEKINKLYKQGKISKKELDSYKKEIRGYITPPDYEE